MNLKLKFKKNNPQNKSEILSVHMFYKLSEGKQR